MTLIVKPEFLRDATHGGLRARQPGAGHQHPHPEHIRPLRAFLAKTGLGTASLAHLFGAEAQTASALPPPPPLGTSAASPAFRISRPKPKE